MAFTARSLAARHAILAAARRQFGDEGFERTTVRSVATEAGVDPAMVMRYYGSKVGLFVSAVEIDLALPDPAAVPHERVGQALAERFVQLWEGPEGQPALQILLRSAGSTPAAQQRARAIFDGQVRGIVRLALNTTPGQPPGQARVVTGRQPALDSDLIAARVGSYVLGTALVRYILKFGPLAGLSADDLIVEMGAVLQQLIDLH